MGGKKYPKKKDGPEGSASTQKPTASASTQEGPSGQQNLLRGVEQLSVSSQSGQGQQPKQSKAQQQQGGQQQHSQQGGSQQQRQQQGGPQQQRQQQSGQQQRGGQQQDRRPQQQHQEQRPQQQQQGGPQQQRQQQGGPQQQRQQQSGQQQDRRPQQQQQQQWGPQKGQERSQQQRDAWPKQGGGERSSHQQMPRMPRTESMQSVRSEQSTSSGGAKQQKQQERPKQLTMEDLKKKGIEGLTVKYKGAGTRGKKLGDIETNYLRLIMDKLVPNAYHYDVTIEPDRPKKLLTMVFLKFIETNFPKECIAFDGSKNAFATKPLKLGDMVREIKIIHPETKRERTFTVAIQQANDYEIPIRGPLSSYQNSGQAVDPQRAMQAVEVVLKSAFHQSHLASGVSGGRAFYFRPSGRRFYLGDFYELWLGLFQSMVLGKTPLLNVDVNHKAFPKRYGSFIELLQDMERDMRKDINPRQPLDYDVQQVLKRHLSGLEICYNKPNDNPMIYKFMGIVDTPDKVKFRLENGEEKTILRYFQDTNRRINYPNLPCIKLGNTVKNITVPMELCSIPDTQIINKKCTENQTRNIIKEAATSTDVRKQKIMDLLNQIRHNGCPTIQGFGINVDPNFTKVPARQLDAPGIQYRNSVVKPQKGVWRADNLPFLGVNENLIEWSILNTNYRTRQNELQEFGSMLFKISQTTGLRLAPQPTDIRSFSDRDTHKINQEIERIGNDKRISIVFCVVPDSGRTYSDIKKMAEINSKNGVLTQCIKGNTIFKKRNDASTISNILLKVNAKLNGTNHRLDKTPILMDQKCLLIGADVTHPSPEQTRIPSVVGVAASFDSNAFCYKFYWRLQGQRIEIIGDLKDIIKEHLKFYKQKNGVLPAKILYYRDGVSEGQFDQVMAIEKSAMADACREIEPGYDKKVKMTVVVVQKRHHTRFFPGNTAVGRDDRRNNNVPAGTIVDTVITRPNENHFYLVSHQSIQGVAKPTKYCILLDEGNHSIDDLQGLTYNLCHLFTRCNRAVSYPAPTYYAHLAAYRGRVYIENETLNMNNLQSEWSKRPIKENIINGRPMFFV